MVTNLAQARSEDDDFINFPHLFEEIVDAGTFEDMEVMPVILDFDRYNKVSIRDSLREQVRNNRNGAKSGQNAHLEATVNQSFVEIQH